MEFGSTQSLTDMSNKIICGEDKGGPCVGLLTLPPSFADCVEILEL